MRKPARWLALGIIALANSQGPIHLAIAQAPGGELKCLGMVGIKNGVYGMYLQSYAGGDKEGQLHCSNPHRNEEETWFLWEISGQQRVYAITNWRNGKFLSAKENGCAKADSVLLTKSEKWRLVSGKSFEVDNAVAFCSVSTGHYLGTQEPGNDIDACGGEVGCGAGSPDGKPVPPTQGDKNYVGWWVMESATEPDPGGPTLNDITKFIIKIVPVAVEVISAL